MIDREDNPELHIAITPAHHPSSLVHYYSDDINENELNGIKELDILSNSLMAY